MRLRLLAAALVLAATGCATAPRPVPPAAVARDLAPQPLARRILAGVRHDGVLAQFDRRVTVAPGTLTVRLLRPRLDGAREVLQLRLVPGRGETRVYASAWNEARRGPTGSDPQVAGSLDSLVEVVRVAAGTRVAVLRTPARVRGP